MPSITFSTIQQKDLETLRNWRNLPRIRNNMYNTNIISSEQQINWFKSLHNDSERRYFLCLLDEKPVGALYFTDITVEECHWGCYLGEERVWPGMGLVLEIAALEYAFDRLQVNTIKADVLSFNLPPQTMHRIFLYKENGYKYIIREGEKIKVLLYTYTRKSWATNKQKVFVRIPAKIVQAAQLAEFIQMR